MNDRKLSILTTLAAIGLLWMLVHTGAQANAPVYLLSNVNYEQARKTPGAVMSTWREVATSLAGTTFSGVVFQAPDDRWHPTLTDYLIEVNVTPAARSAKARRREAVANFFMTPIKWIDDQGRSYKRSFRDSHRSCQF